MESGLKTRPKGMASTFMQMVLSMKECGKMTNKMETAKRNGQMDRLTKDSTLMGINTEKELLRGRMVRVIQENLRTIS